MIIALLTLIIRIVDIQRFFWDNDPFFFLGINPTLVCIIYISRLSCEIEWDTWDLTGIFVTANGTANGIFVTSDI
jgi:hypothetical protein